MDSLFSFNLAPKAKVKTDTLRKTSVLVGFISNSNSKFY